MNGMGTVFPEIQDAGLASSGVGGFHQSSQRYFKSN